MSNKNIFQKITEKAQDYYKNNSKNVNYAGIGIAILLLALAGYKWYMHGQNEKGMTELIEVQKAFANDSFNLCLNGSPKFKGAIKIADKYSGTKAGNLAHYYAGISYLQTGKFKEAADHLEDFEANDRMIKPMAIGALGDCYSELGDLNKAASQYMKAAKSVKNEFTSVYWYTKAGDTYTTIEKYEDALEAFKAIEKDFKDVELARNAKKMIVFLEAKIGKYDYKK